MTFPALDSGTIVQLPVSLNLRHDTHSNVFHDGSYLEDSTRRKMHYKWKCRYENLSVGELGRFVEFWYGIGRGGRPFVFYDPLGNLLSNSDNLASPTWIQSGEIQIQSIPTVGEAQEWLLTNSGDNVASVSQSLEIDPGFSVAFSVNASWEGNASFNMSALSLAGNVTEQFSIASPSRCELVISPNSQSSVRQLSLELPPRSQIIVSGPQVEIGWKAGSYLKTVLGGIHAEAWIEQRDFSIRSVTPNAHAVEITIQSRR